MKTFYISKKLKGTEEQVNYQDTIKNLAAAKAAVISDYGDIENTIIKDHNLKIIFRNGKL